MKISFELSFIIPIQYTIIDKQKCIFLLISMCFFIFLNLNDIRFSFLSRWMKYGGKPRQDKTAFVL